MGVRLCGFKSRPRHHLTRLTARRFTSIPSRDAQGDVAKWLRRRSAKPLFGGSNPPVASNCSSFPPTSLRTGPSTSLRTGPSTSLRTGFIPYSAHRRPASSALHADSPAPKRWTPCSTSGISGYCGARISAPTAPPGCSCSAWDGWSRTCLKAPQSAGCSWCRWARSIHCPAFS